MDPRSHIPFMEFPEDVQFCTLSFLSPSTIAAFARTSKRSLSLCSGDSGNPLWHALCDRRWGSKTLISQWGQGKISFKLLYRTLSVWDSLIGFWRIIPRSSLSSVAFMAALVLFEWGPTFLVGSRVSPSSRNGEYGVVKSPFLLMSLSPTGEAVYFLDKDGKSTRFPSVEEARDWGLTPVNVSFMGASHFLVEEKFLASGHEEDDSGDFIRQRKRRMLRWTWDPQHFLKILNCSPTSSRPLQGLWKGIGADAKLDIYLVTYNESGGISCRRVGDSSVVRALGRSLIVFYTLESSCIAPPFSPEELFRYESRIHHRVLADYSSCPSAANDNSLVVSSILFCYSSFNQLAPDVDEGARENSHLRKKGRIWRYRDGTFGFGFLKDNLIIDLKPFTGKDQFLEPDKH
ncbi:hypothetical protein SAY87_004948 [Trapa incisa]|uniref:F-box protein n=1 Tax=Trapa incisa TaxID=236973 RepID=A0AAN7JPT0_9MYRT|nr:hypothetical protein SAY87_004948 [Trapa incisa]